MLPSVEGSPMVRCLECSAKIGWLRRPVSGLYCSARCRDSARAKVERLENELLSRLAAEHESLAAVERLKELNRLESDAASLLRMTSEVVRKGAGGRSHCPKCSEQWEEVQGGGSFGKNRGRCTHCGFSAEFLKIEDCPHCRCHSLVVETEDDARCPRCKSRPRRQRQIA